MQTNTMKPYAIISLIALLVAAATGSLLRFGLFLGMPDWAQNYLAVRHAHSHLMYFGWGTLGIMALLWQWLPRLSGRPLPHGVYWQMGATAILALLSFPAFWSNGYGPTRIGALMLPLGSIVSGLSGLTWLFFIFLYVRATWGLPIRPLAVQLWDWAIALLLLACFGVIGLMATILGEHPSFFLHQAMLHLFLDIFAVGWFGMALLGLAWAWIGGRASTPGWLPTGSLALALAPTFFLGMPPALVPPAVYAVAVAANLATALLLGWHGWMLWQRRAFLPALVQFGLWTLAVHVLIGVILLWPGLWQWASATQLRVFFLHNLLLGWLSSVLLGLIVAQWLTITTEARQILVTLWIGGVAVMLIALLGLGLAGIVPISTLLWLRVAAWSSLPLVGVSLIVTVVATRKEVGRTVSPSYTAEARVETPG
ncbi:MAG: hypothetical protein KF893_13400 [Caldilineaceae bacterium]|nr:hypothetical protein [Caldilineaceae bacterium]